MPASYEQVSDILTQHGFVLHGMSDDGPEAEAGFLKTRSSALVWVTVPCNCTTIADSVIHRIMATAKIPHKDYAALVNTPPGNTLS